jgi:hypothetical protein
MATVTKDFRIKSGLVVEGATGTINGSPILTEANIGSGNPLELVQDIVGGMVSTNTENGISVEYDDTNGKLNFNVSDPTITISGDVDGNAVMTNLGDTNISVTLDTVNSNVGSFGGSTKIPTFTVNGKGLLTAAGEVNVATDLAIAGDTGTDTVSLLTDTLTFEGGTGITSTISNNKVTVDIDSTVATLTDQQTLTNKILSTNVDLGADLDAATYKIVNLGTPTNAADAATKAYVDSTAQGIDWKASVRAATTATVDLSTNLENGDVLDGVTLATGNRVLVKNQVAGYENGIYVVAASGAPTRSTDADTAAELTSNFAVFVEEGTTNADQGYVLTNDGTITIGTTALEFTQFTGLGQVTAGTGLSKAGNTIGIDETVTATKAHVDLLIGDETVNGSAGNTVSDRIETLANDLTDYVDGFLDSSTGSTVGYIDEQDTTTLAAANAYSDEVTDAAILTANSYSDEVSDAALLSANGYSDSLVAAGDATATPTYLALDINDIAKQIAATVGPVAATQTVAYAFAKADYRSAKFLVKVAYSTHTEVSEVLLTLDTSDNIAITEYAVVGTNGSSSAISAGISGSNIQLLVTPVNANSNITVYGTLMA